MENGGCESREHYFGHPIDRVTVDEALDVQHFYGSSVSLQPVGDMVDAMARHQLQRCSGGSLAHGAPELLQGIRARSLQYGVGHYLMTGRLVDEECERELEQEEEEEEKEEEVLMLAPCRLTAWGVFRAAQTSCL